MFRLLTVLFVLLSLVDTLQAQRPPVIIRFENRVPNTRQGCCGPATLESVARHQGYRSLNGIVAARSALPYNPPRLHPVCGTIRSHPCQTWMNGMAKELGQRGIPYQVRMEGSYDRRLIEQGLKVGKPVIVGINGRHICEPGHFYAVVGRQGSDWLLFDTNKPKVPYTTHADGWFRQRWDGSSLLLGR